MKLKCTKKRSFPLRVSLHLLKKSLIENFIFLRSVSSLAFKTSKIFTNILTSTRANEYTVMIFSLSEKNALTRSQFIHG